MCDAEPNDEFYILPELQESADASLSSSDLPAKSKNRYELTYQSFQKWQESHDMTSVDEHVLLAYFQEQSTIKTPATLWSLYSMLKSMIKLQLNVNIGNYTELLAFLKEKSKGYTSAKPKIFTDEEITKFIEEAPDITYLATKVVLIFCVSGACRTDELVNLCIDDVEVHGQMYLIKIPKCGTYPARSFVICDQYFDIVRKYHLLRPPNVQCNRFFLNYQKGKCTVQVIGKNKFCKMAHEIAQFLKLEDADRYTGYSYRRTSTVLTKDSLNGKNTTGITSSISQSPTLSASIYKNYDLEQVENTVANIAAALTRTIPALPDAYLTISDDSTTSVGMIEDTNLSEIAAAEMGLSNSEPIFCDVNNVKIEAPDSPSQANEPMNEPSHSGVFFRDTNVKCEEINYPCQVLETQMGPSNSDVFLCGEEAMDEDLNSPLSTSELVFCDGIDLDDESTGKKQLPGTKPRLSNSKRFIRSPNSGPEEMAGKTCEQLEQLLPKQSKEKYNSVYHKFYTWRKTKNVVISENVMLSYFTELMETMQPSSLWAMYSMLKTTIKIYDQCDIGVYSNLIAFLKRNSENYTPKKSSVLSDENIEKFLNEAPDDEFLAIKVALIFGIMGGLRIEELVNILQNDITEHNGILLVRIPKTNSKKSKSFTIHDEYFDIVKKYISLRPAKSTCSNRFFLNYRNRACTVQPIGKNKLANMPRRIAEYLGLENPKLYTGHSFRRSSTTLLGNAIGDLFTLKRGAGLHSSKAADCYDESAVSKTKTALIASAINLPVTSAQINSDIRAPQNHSTDSGASVNASETFLKNHRPPEKKAGKVKASPGKSASAESDLSEESDASPNEDSSDSESKTSINIEGITSPSQVLEMTMESSKSDLFFCETAMPEQPHSPSSTSELVFCNEIDPFDASTHKEQLQETTPQLSNSEHVIGSPNSLEEIVNKTCEQLLPPQSKDKYYSVYVKFQTWRKAKNDPISEDLMLSYFGELVETIKPSSLWAIFSMLKTTIKIYDQCDIGAYSNVIALLKRNSENYTPRKSSVLSDENIAKFLNDAPDDHFLAMKVALIFGVMGGLRVDELVKIVKDDVTEHNGIFLVRIRNTNSKKPKSFTIHDEYFNIVKRYTLLRPQKSGCSNRFFLTYRNRCCIVQPIGKNTLASIPKKIAEYLGLENPELYTGHSFRRSSTTRLGNAIGDLFTLKRTERWQASKIAESCQDESMASKIIASNLIASAINPPSTSPTEIKCDIPAVPLHCPDERVTSKRSLEEAQPSSSNANASDTNKKMRTFSPTNSSSADHISDTTPTPSRRPFIPRRRYVSDWKRSDMNSPILARRFFDFATNSISRKNETLYHLRSENQRLASRVDSLKNLLNQMKNSRNSENASTMREQQ